MKRFLFLLILSIYSCNKKVCLEESSIDEMKNIFSKNSLSKEYFQSLKEYKLSNEDIKLSEELMEKAFIKYNNNLDRGNYRFEKLPNYKEYGYILSPCIDKKGDVIVLINAYLTGGECTELGPIKEWFEVRDGGNSLIRFNVNLSTKEVSYIMPNGEA